MIEKKQSIFIRLFFLLKKCYNVSVDKKKIGENL